jgi:hypothetical protein
MFIKNRIFLRSVSAKVFVVYFKPCYLLHDVEDGVAGNT